MEGLGCGASPAAAGPVDSCRPSRVFRYTREDGVPMTATLYLPPGYEPKRDGPLPTILWAYPK